MKYFISMIVVMLFNLTTGGYAMALSIKSPSFSQQGLIPQQYTCDGENISPPLEWDNVPDKTQSYALIVDDPDAPAGLWVHWLLFNIPLDLKHLEEGATLPAGAISGQNSWGQIGYRGPCPPSGTHRYRFKLYALDTQINLDASATKVDLDNAMMNHVIEQAELIGLFR